VHNW